MNLPTLAKGSKFGTVGSGLERTTEPSHLRGEQLATRAGTVDAFERLLEGETEKARYRTLVNTLAEWRQLFLARRVLDFGASIGTSAAALLQLGAAEVIGVEPDLERVNRGVPLLAQAGLGDRGALVHVPDTSALPFGDGAFCFVLANAVIEHIPPPRKPYIRELWRVVARGGCLMINETPNMYVPREIHTTKLWFNHWLPRDVAYRRAVRRGRFDPHRVDWDSSGWRGLGYFELVSAIRGYRLIPEHSRLRHRLLSALGVPASLFDPYPTWVLQRL